LGTIAKLPLERKRKPRKMQITSVFFSFSM
jgi:hypothetical protein